MVIIRALLIVKQTQRYGWYQEKYFNLVDKLLATANLYLMLNAWLTTLWSIYIFFVVIGKING